MAEKLLVPFEGEGSGVGELSWGQQTIWRGIEGRGAPMWLLGLQPVPHGQTVADLANLLSFIMSRHQSLRTRLRRSDGGHVQQVVASSGEIALEIVDVADDDDPLAFAQALKTAWGQADLDYANQWPVRMAVVRHRGVPAYRVMAMCHMVSDGFGVLAMMADMAARNPSTGSPKGPITAMEPLEQAIWQASPAGRRRSAIAERYWDRLLRTIPPRMFAEPAEGRTPRFAQAVFNSPATYLATQQIAARTQVDTSPVLLAAFAVALTRTTGVSPAAFRVYVNNRFQPRLADTVSPIAQTCPCLVDVAGTTFDEAVRRAYYASIAAYKHAYFEPARIREILAAVSEERGVQIDLSCVYNDRRMGTPRAVATSLPEPDDLRAALPRTTLRWEHQDDDDSCHIQVRDCPDSVEVLVMTDSQYVSLPDIESVLREIEAVTVRAAFDPCAPSGV